jgi:hypothetical protein
MSVTQAGDIAGIVAASRNVIAGVDGIASAFVLTTTVPPEDVHLPAAVQHISLDDLEPASIEYLTQQEVITHRWALDVYAVERSGDLYADQVTAMAFVPKVLAAYRSNMTLGAGPAVQRCLPTSYRFITASYGSRTFFGIRFQMEAKAKRPVTIS